MKTDSSNNLYREVEIPGGHIRVTRIEIGWDDSPSIRIQVRQGNGHLLPGPEIPINVLNNLYNAINQLSEVI